MLQLRQHIANVKVNSLKSIKDFNTVLCLMGWPIEIISFSIVYFVVFTVAAIYGE